MRKKLLLIAVISIMTMTVFSQELPQDKNVRKGKLDNGMTYYIRHNEKPEHRAEFYIAQKVGSILEEKEQRGLAHFLEHMAFNGTSHFPGNKLIDFLERNGVKFGENVNAGTGVDQTVYMLVNVPTSNEKTVDSCLLILHDWSNSISLDEKEIDKERGVILEELRSRNSAYYRMLEKMLPEIYPNCKYSDCLPGGSPDIVANFKYQTLRDYYKKWYRPDLQGIVVVGDIDVDKIEAEIKTMFADIHAQVNSAPRTHYEVTKNIEPIVSICSDPEATSYQIMMFNKQDAYPDSLKNNLQYFVQRYALDIVSTMMNNRFEDIAKQPNPPFVYGYSYYSTYYVAQTEDAWTIMADAKDAASIKEALVTLVHENNRMKQFGFTASEYERAKADFMKEIESRYNERAKQENGNYVQECLNNFLTGEPLMGIENEYSYYSQIIPMVPLQAINELASMLVSDTNHVITLTAPEKSGEVLPTKSDIISIIQTADKDVVSPYEDFVSSEPLISKLPKAGKVKKETAVKEFDATQWTLNNGVKVIFKPTTYKDDEIQMASYCFGGTSVMDIKDAVTVRSLDELIDIGGVGNFSAIDLPKMLAGKKVTVKPFIDSRIEGITGKCTPKDLETMIQLVYLYFTQPRTDEQAFESYKTRTAAVLENMESSPMTTLLDSMNSVVYSNHPFVIRTKVSDLQNIDYNLAMKLYKERFEDAKNFVFVFVGNIDPKVLKPLVEQYLGSLPVTKRNETWKDNGLKIATGNKQCIYDKKVETPISTIFLLYNGKMKYTQENMIYMKALADIMDIVYTEKVREDEGGTYGVSCYGDVRLRPEESFSLQIFFQTNAGVRDKLIGIVKDEMKNVSVNGPSEVNLNKEKEFLLKHHQELLQDNSYWLGVIEDYYSDGIDEYSHYTDIVNSMTIESMKQFAKQIVAGELKELIQNGVK